MAASSALDKLFNNTGVTTFNMAVSPAVDKHFKPYWILWISSTEVDDTVPFLSTREIFEDHIRAQALPNTELDIRVDVHRINCDNPSTGNQAGEIVKTIGICRFNQMTQAARAWGMSPMSPYLHITVLANTQPRVIQLPRPISPPIPKFRKHRRILGRAIALQLPRWKARQIRGTCQRTHTSTTPSGSAYFYTANPAASHSASASASNHGTI